MPKAKTPAKSPKATDAKPVKQAAAPAQEAVPAAPAKPAKAPPHPVKEQPMWARMNQGHSQKMAKGRPFRHQGR